MKGIFTTITFLLFLLSISLNAQITTSSQWTWMKGDNLGGAHGVYGVQGVAADGNKPGARFFSTTWTDTAGSFWLFGGVGYPVTGDYGHLNDLWKYSTATNRWTWINGDSTKDQYGTYDTIGTPASTNMPGARYENVTWTDTAGNFWLFGGYGFTTSRVGFVGYLNDVWKYSPATNRWTWINGDSTRNQYGTYGTIGTPASTNKPGARVPSATWTDTAGNFWLFGGTGYVASGSAGSLNDLWKYSPATNQWTWMKGTDALNQHGVYGVIGTPFSANEPGARFGSVTWTDATGNFWLFGGYGYAAAGSSGQLNDLWKYSTATNQWTWIKGSNTADQSGVYGTMGTPSSSNGPGARNRSATWVDITGNLLLFGGIGYDASSSLGYLNDFWKYSPAINQWTWINGSNITNQSGAYGIMGAPSSANMPGGRYASETWTDATGNPWLFGGIGYDVSSSGYLNDLWKLGNSSILPVTLISVKAYQQNSGITIEWKVENESGIKHYDVEKSSDGITFTKVAVQVVKRNNFSAVDYSWRDLNAVAGNNFYRIRRVGLDDEMKYSQVIKVSIGKGKPAYELCPNPVVNGIIQLQFIDQAKGVYHVRLLNTSGQVMFTDRIVHEAGSSTQTITPGSHILKGNYILEITAPDKRRQPLKVIY